MNTRSFAGRVFVVVLGLLLLIGCVVTSLIAIKWLTPSDNQTVAVETAEKCVEDEKVAKDVEEVETTTGEANIPEKICKFAEDFDSEGKVVPAGTTVNGPAAVKPDRDRDHAILILPGSSYVTSATDEVLWLYVGDYTCVLAQGQFFSTSEIK